MQMTLTKAFSFKKVSGHKPIITLLLQFTNATWSQILPDAVLLALSTEVVTLRLPRCASSWSQRCDSILPIIHAAIPRDSQWCTDRKERRPRNWFVKTNGLRTRQVYTFTDTCDVGRLSVRKFVSSHDLLSYQSVLDERFFHV